MTNNQENSSEPVVEKPATAQADQFIKTLLMCVLTIGLLAAVGIPLWLAKTRNAEASRQLAEFSLTDRSGKTITRSDVSNKLLVVNFVFSGCSLSCRAVYDHMAEIERLLGSAPEVRLVSLTIDPRTDTPAVLGRFADQYTNDGKNWLFLTGEKKELFQLIEKSFLERSPKLQGLVPGGFKDIHLIFVVDAQGRIHRSFNGLETGVAEKVIQELKKLRQRA